MSGCNARRCRDRSAKPHHGVKANLARIPWRAHSFAKLPFHGHTATRSRSGCFSRSATPMSRNTAAAPPPKLRQFRTNHHPWEQGCPLHEALIARSGFPGGATHQRQTPPKCMLQTLHATRNYPRSGLLNHAVLRAIQMVTRLAVRAPSALTAKSMSRARISGHAQSSGQPLACASVRVPACDPVSDEPEVPSGRNRAATCWLYGGV